MRADTIGADLSRIHVYTKSITHEELSVPKAVQTRQKLVDPKVDPGVQRVKSTVSIPCVFRSSRIEDGNVSIVSKDQVVGTRPLRRSRPLCHRILEELQRTVRIESNRSRIDRKTVKESAIQDLGAAEPAVDQLEPILAILTDETLGREVLVWIQFVKASLGGS